MRGASPMHLSPEQVHAICKGDPEIITAFNALLQVIDQQAKRIVELEQRVQELERQLGQNSNNSSKPPSSDGFRKTNNLRQSGGKKGAPKGHPGQTLRMVAQPDEIQIHPHAICTFCHTSLADIPAQRYEARQVFDLPPVKWSVTEHRAETKCCPSCRATSTAAFPERVKAPVQYGDTLRAWTSYLSVYQLLPLERIAQLFEDLTDHGPSEATLLSHLQQMYTSLTTPEQQIQQHLLRSPLIHADETGFRVNGSGVWMHTASNGSFTHLTVHSSRGTQGMAAGGILPAYKGTVVHDCYGPYFNPKSFSFRHVLCNAHLLRECQGITENDNHQWSGEMKTLLQESWSLVCASRESGKPLPELVVQEIEQHYDDILFRGREEWSKNVVARKKGVRGRQAKGKAGNLAERFEKWKSAILAFLRDAHVPFDNNQAERDIRMVKVKTKISGAFRTEAGAEHFARIRGVISTLLKQKRPILESLSSALQGRLQF
ncbi:IS66 family transposase [Paenibacillus faecis]|uniref:IS66 family transposase n=2 Tax=Paenibacillus faecis TaxID=862114 RepID=A0A5D0D120_9BACL|nr:IS66 family transposase [Paenibacillus faecis]